MHLDSDKPTCSDGISQGITIVRIGAWVEHQAVGPSPIFVDEVDQPAFMIRLKYAQQDFARACVRAQLGVKFV